jgi:hypothetical protein
VRARGLATGSVPDGRADAGTEPDPQAATRAMNVANRDATVQVG